MELTIPFAAIGIDRADLPDNLALNVYRCRSCGESPVHTSWSPPLTEQHYRPKRFGTIVLSNTPTSRPDTGILLPQSENDVGSGAAAGPGWYKPGGILNGKPFVGNPNTLTRRDRMVIRFNLAPLALPYGEGGITKATLQLIPVGFSGPEDGRLLELSHLLYDTAVLSWKDVVDERTSVVATVDAPRETVCHDGLSIDVTAQVKADLVLGRPASSFRLRDVGSEQGNADMLPDGLCFPNFRSRKLRLELEFQHSYHLLQNGDQK